MKKINIGLDIGIASVGWAITDENLKLLKHGARLFETVDDAKDSKLLNETRREKRSLRRQITRRKTLKRDFICMLIKNKYIDIEFDKKGVFVQKFLEKYIDGTLSMLDLREKALKDSLEKKELINVLYWYLSHRGFKYEVAGEEAIEKQVGLPVEIQRKHFEENGIFKGENNRNFHNNDYLKEIKQLFDKQPIDEKIKKDFIELFTRQRTFEQGPGGEKSPTKYGVWQLVDGSIKRVAENIWDKTIGRCSIYVEEYRAPKNSLSAQIFNLLNDLNNLTFDNQKLSLNDKKEILKISFEYKTNTGKIIKFIEKEYGVSKEQIKGFRIDKNKKPLTTQLTSVHDVNKFFISKNEFIKYDDIFPEDKFNQENIVDELVNIFSRTKILENGIDGRIDRIREKFGDKFSNDKLQEQTRKISSYSETHSLSYKALQQMIPWLMEEPKNQMELLHEKTEFEQIANIDFANKKYIPTQWIDEVITTPTVKRSLRQAIKVINRIIKTFKEYTIDNIVIEMAREHKNKEARDNERNMQKYFEEINKSIASQIEALEKQGPIYGKAKERLWLYEQQKGRDAYTGEKLDLNQVVFNPNYSDVDHIIPYSQCFTNSRINKVLTLKENNSKKGKQTPYQYIVKEFGEAEFLRMEKLWEEWYSPKNRKIFASYKKLEFISTRKDFSKLENQFDFINRNLVDTRYTTKALLNYLTEFFRGKNTKIKTINGKFTSFVRKYVDKKEGNKVLKRPQGVLDGSFDENGKKIRDWHGHHAEDALIVIYAALANMQTTKLIEKIINDPFNQKSNKKGEAILNTFDPQTALKFDQIREELNNNLENIKFSYMMNKKRSIQLHNDTLYSSFKSKEDDNVYKVTTINLIDLKKEECIKIFETKKIKTKMEQFDLPTFEVLKDVYKNYKNEKLPFAAASNGDKTLELILNKKGKKVKRPVKKIKVYTTKVNLDKIITRENNQTSKVIFHESLNWVELHLFKDKNDKNYIIPINALVANFNNGDIKFKHNYFQEIKDMKFKNQTPIILYKGSLFKDQNDAIYRLSGYTSSKLEFKILDRNHKDRIRKSVSFLEKMNLLEIDELGNIFKIKKL